MKKTLRMSRNADVYNTHEILIYMDENMRWRPSQNIHYPTNTSPRKRKFKMSFKRTPKGYNH